MDYIVNNMFEEWDCKYLTKDENNIKLSVINKANSLNCFTYYE